MMGHITIKHWIKRLAGGLAVTAALLPRRTAHAICIFCYHRVADIGFVDPHIDDWNVPPATFERQIATLTESTEIVSLPELHKRMAIATAPSKPLVCLTFDDAFGNFHSNVLPILKRYQVPASVFAVTGTVGQKEPMPFDSWSQRHYKQTPSDVWRPMNWTELEACMASGLVTVGGHSHRHRNGLECSPVELKEEAYESFSLLKERLGSEACRFYAYPYGSHRLGQVTPAYVQAVQDAGYESAVSTDLDLATPESDPFLLPRIEAHTFDGPSVMLAKARGILGPYRLTDRLRRAKRLTLAAETKMDLRNLERS